MAQLAAYLKLDGDCREAMTFYEECFGNALSFTAVKGSALEQHKKPLWFIVIHKPCVKGLAGEQHRKTEEGDTVFLWLNCKSEEEIKTTFEKLSKDGTITTELQPAYWGATFGAVTDKFGMSWYISKIRNHG